MSTQAPFPVCDCHGGPGGLVIAAGEVHECDLLEPDQIVIPLYDPRNPNIYPTPVEVGPRAETPELDGIVTFGVVVRRPQPGRAVLIIGGTE